MRFSHFSLLGIFAAAHATPLEQRQAANPTVTINNGRVIGTVTGVSNQPSAPPVKAFLGIPYAQPPTGARRFAPPEPASPWRSPLRAQKLPPACLQQFGMHKPLGKDFPVLISRCSKRKDEAILQQPNTPSTG